MATAMPRGWGLVGWAALAACALTALAFALEPAETALPAALRWTAHLSGTIFLAAFSASSLRALRPGAGTRWLLANRRYVGVSFGAVHGVHGVLVIVALWTRPDMQPDITGLLGGSLTYVFIAAMVATSFDRSAAWLGARRWKLLHTTGGWLIWLVFVTTWAGAVAAHPISALFTLLGLAALGVRFAAVRARRAAAA